MLRFPLQRACHCIPSKLSYSKLPTEVASKPAHRNQTTPTKAKGSFQSWFYHFCTSAKSRLLRFKDIYREGMSIYAEHAPVV